MENRYLELCKEEIETAIDNIQNDTVEEGVEINVDVEALAKELNNSFEASQAFSMIYEIAELLVKKEIRNANK